VELLFVIFIFIIAYFAFELFDGIVGVFQFYAADDKWIGATAALMLIGIAVVYIFLI
jgi:hypothetical protein